MHARLLSELRTEMDSSEDEASSADSSDSTRNTQVTSTRNQDSHGLSSLFFPSYVAGSFALFADATSVAV